MRAIFLYLVCLALVPALSPAASLQIMQPQNDDKATVGEEFLPIQATFSMPEKEEKEEEAIIVWTIDVGNHTLKTTTKSGESSTLYLSPPSFPFSNSAFGNETLTAQVNNMQFTGNGGYDGADSLELTVIENTGIDYTGYILPTGNSENQDMVVGEDTADLPGCVYQISGFCSEPSKGVPDYGEPMGEPWTSDDPNHWAYWVRQAVRRAAETGAYDDETILDAVWYIVESEYRWFPNELLQEIDFPESGPSRPDESLAPGAPKGFKVMTQADRLDFEWRNPADTDVVEILLIAFDADAMGSVTPDFQPALLAHVDVSVTVPATGPSQVQTHTLNSSFASGSLSDNLKRQYAAIAIDEDGEWSAPAWARRPSALKIKKWDLALNLKKPEKSAFVSTGEFFALPEQVDLIGNGLTFDSEGNGAILSQDFMPYLFTAKSRGRYVYKTYGFGPSGKFTVNVGGSSLSKFAIKSKSDYRGMQGVHPVDVTLETGGFQSNTVIEPALKGKPEQAGAKGSKFRLKKESFESNEMFVESFVATQKTNKANKDSLRYTLYIAGAPVFGEGPKDLGIYNNWFDIQIEDSMWKRQADGRKLTYTGTVESGGTLVIKIDTVKGTLSLFVSQTDLDMGRVEDNTITMGLVTNNHSHVNSLKLQSKTRSNKTTLYY